jgi:predicted DNA-binding transcriptional regulator AlpA
VEVSKHLRPAVHRGKPGIGSADPLGPKPSGEPRCANEQCATYREPRTPVTNGDNDILTLAEVAEMTRTNPATLRYWRSVGDCGPKSFKLGRRVLYHRAGVERWIAEADGS